jgi:hypothetical protein
VTITIVDRLIAAPGPVHLEVLFGDLWRHRLQFRDQPLQAVGILLPRHQDRILGCDHHEIVDALERH